MLFFILIAIVLLLFYVYITWDDDHWKKRNVPYDEPNFLVGGYMDILLAKKHYGVLFKELYEKFQNVPYVGYFKFKTPALIIRDPELIKNILVKDFQHFEKNDMDMDEKIDPLMRASIFMQYGEEWKKNRSYWTSAMTSSKLKLMYDVGKDKCDVMIDHLNHFIEENPHKTFNARDLCLNYFTDSVVTSAFKLKSNCFVEDRNPFKEVSNKFFRPTSWEILGQTLFFMLPRVAKLFGIGFVSKSLNKIMEGIAEDILKIRKDTGFDKNNAFDLIMQDKSEKEFNINAAAIIFNFVTGGTELSASVSAFALYFLAINPEMQRRLREEIVNNVEVDGKPSYDNLHNLSYLEMIINETMRLYPPSPALFKCSTKPYIFPGIKGEQPLKIEAKTPIIIPIYGLHMDPDYYPDPEQFIPERFSEENKKKMNKFAFLPFGEGPRACIGIRMAMNQMKLCISTIVKEFEVRPSPEMKDKAIEIDPNVAVLRPRNEFYITLHKLNK